MKKRDESTMEGILTIKIENGDDEFTVLAKQNAALNKACFFMDARLDNQGSAIVQLQNEVDKIIARENHNISEISNTFSEVLARVKRLELECQ